MAHMFYMNHAVVMLILRIRPDDHKGSEGSLVSQRKQQRSQIIPGFRLTRVENRAVARLKMSGSGGQPMGHGGPSLRRRWHVEQFRARRRIASSRFVDGRGCSWFVVIDLIEHTLNERHGHTRGWNQCSMDVVRSRERERERDRERERESCML